MSSDYHRIVSIVERIERIERGEAEMHEAINMIARGMADLVAIYESLHVRTTGEHVDYSAEDDPAFV
jgi:uncharacterized protein (UPF0335 family)